VHGEAETDTEAALVYDPIVAQAFGDVSDLLAPPQEVLKPRIIWRVLRGNLQHREVTAAERATTAAADVAC
jgi:hypothetical protein